MSKKTEQKKMDKVIEDRTFGLKNKNKSKAVQKYIKGVEQTVKQNKPGEQNKEFLERAEKKKKKEEEAFLASLYKSVKTIRQDDLEEGQEAKNVLCAFFKAGCCEKGDQCEFSHDLNIDFNQGAFDIYTDLRDVKKTGGAESEINKIAEEKERKRGNKVQSNIICKYFLDAVQRRVYGYKWECPNGDDCHYKHCLPKNFVITTSKDRMQEEMSIEDYMNLEENIDAEREKISKTGTPVNDTTFLAWKKKRDEFRKAAKEDQEKKKKSGQTGLQLFRNQQNLFKDDENATGDAIVVDENNQLDEEEQKKEENVPRTEDDIMNDLDKDLKGIKINAELFAQEDGLDDLPDDIDGDGDGEIQEEEKDNSH